LTVTTIMFWWKTSSEGSKRFPEPYNILWYDSNTKTGSLLEDNELRDSVGEKEWSTLYSTWNQFYRRVQIKRKKNRENCEWGFIERGTRINRRVRLKRNWIPSLTASCLQGNGKVYGCISISISIVNHLTFLLDRVLVTQIGFNDASESLIQKSKRK